MGVVKTRDDFGEQAAVERLAARLAQSGVSGFVLVTLRPAEGRVQIAEHSRGLAPVEKMSLMHSVLGYHISGFARALQQAQAPEASAQGPQLVQVEQ